MSCSFMVSGILPNWHPSKLGCSPQANSKCPICKRPRCRNGRRHLNVFALGRPAARRLGQLFADLALVESLTSEPVCTVWRSALLTGPFAGPMKGKRLLLLDVVGRFEVHGNSSASVAELNISKHSQSGYPRGLPLSMPFLLAQALNLRLLAFNRGSLCRHRVPN